MLISFPFALAVAVQSIEQPAKGSPEQRAMFERGQRAQHAFEQRLFVEAGFQPLAKVAAAKRTVRRVLFQDPYLMLPVPGIELERHGDGRATLRVIGPGTSGPTMVLPGPAWGRLLALEPGVFFSRCYVPWEPRKLTDPTPPPPPTCHGVLVRFDAADDGEQRSASWGACGGGKDDPKLAYAAEVARLAVTSRPACSVNGAEPLSSFIRCFTPKPPIAL